MSDRACRGKRTLSWLANIPLVPGMLARTSLAADRRFCLGYAGPLPLPSDVGPGQHGCLTTPAGHPGLQKAGRAAACEQQRVASVAAIHAPSFCVSEQADLSRFESGIVELARAVLQAHAVRPPACHAAPGRDSLTYSLGMCSGDCKWVQACVFQQCDSGWSMNF